MTIYGAMLKQNTKSHGKHIDSFLRKEPKILRKLDEMVKDTNEFVLKQHLFYSLLKLTSDVHTFKSELVSYLANDKNLAHAIVKKATMLSKRSVSSFLAPKITKTDVQKSIQKIGYGAVHNELQIKYAEQYVDLYYKRKEQEFKSIVKKSVKMAFLVIELAKLVGYKDITSAFFAAMNYSIGEMVLFMRDHKRYEEYKKLLQKGLSEKTAELASFGFDLGELAAKMLSKWELPEHVIDVVANKENPEEIRAKNQDLDTLLRFSTYILKAMEKEDSNPSSLWVVANDYLLKLGLEIDLDKWQEEIKHIYIKVLETEYSLFNRTS